MSLLKSIGFPAHAGMNRTAASDVASGYLLSVLASGVPRACEDERRRILGVSVALSEAEVHWRAFLENLQSRGMRGVEYVVSDDHAGLRAARTAVLGGVKWQRCQFHLAQNAIHHSPNLAIRKRIIPSSWAIWLNGPPRCSPPSCSFRSISEVSTISRESVSRSLPRDHAREVRRSRRADRIRHGSARAPCRSFAARDRKARLAIVMRRTTGHPGRTRFAPAEGLGDGFSVHRAPHRFSGWRARRCRWRRDASRRATTRRGRRRSR